MRTFDADEIERAGPCEGDLVTDDHRTVCEYGLEYSTKAVLMTTPETFNKDVQAYMDRERFHPNVWFISDHGNAHLIYLAED